MTTTCCFCPTDVVNWDKPGGLCEWNWPCDSKTTFPIYNWYVDDTKETDVIIIPDKDDLIPFFIVALPCFWIIVCMFVPLVEANILKIYEKNGNLKLDYLCKNACSESIKYSRKKIISASLDEEKAGIFTSRKLRISFLCDNGMAPDKGQWLIMNSLFEESVLKRCVDLINSKIAGLNERNDNSAFISNSVPQPQQQPVYDFSQPLPMTYGHLQPQLQVQPQVYYNNNSQLRPKPQPQQPQIANDKAIYISNPVPQQPQQPVYDFSQQQQPLAYGHPGQPQMQAQPQVYYVNNNPPQPQPQPQVANGNAAYVSIPVLQQQQPVFDFSQQQPLAYGHPPGQPQMQVQPQVYYHNNPQPQPQQVNGCYSIFL